MNRIKIVSGTTILVDGSLGRFFALTILGNDSLLESAPIFGPISLPTLSKRRHLTNLLHLFEEASTGPVPIFSLTLQELREADEL